MRALAEYIMRGRMQATLVVVGSAAMPLLFWLSAAAGSLVLLRRGASDAIGILAWALLPAIAWWYFGEPRTALVLVGALVLLHAWIGHVTVNIGESRGGYTPKRAWPFLAAALAAMLRAMQSASQLD